MKSRIGYLIPEFPGQTHIFFWREMQALGDLGIELDLLSTKYPPTKLMSHTWTAEVQQQTTYLFPLGRNLVPACLEFLRAGPQGWLRCLQTILKADDVTLAERLRLAALALVGAELAFLARTHNWQHIHVHSCANSANVALFATQLSPLTYSLTLHGPLSDYGPNQKQKWQFAAFAIVITKKLYGEVNEALANHLPPMVEIAPMGVNTVRFNRQTPYLAWNGQAECRLFSSGRLNPCKGHADLIRAVHLLKQQGFEIQLAIAGEDEFGGTGYHKDLEALIQQLDLSHSVKLLGAVSEETIMSFLEQAHVYTLASLHEPLGVAIMEAMAMELPVVVTGAGGVKELVDDGISGVLVPPEDPAALASAIANVLKNPTLALNLSHQARQRVMTEFSYHRSAEVLTECLRNLP